MAQDPVDKLSFDGRYWVLIVFAEWLSHVKLSPAQNIRGVRREGDLKLVHPWTVYLSMLIL